MILITKDEAESVRRCFPDVHIVRTMKQHSDRHRYYCEESWKVLRFLGREPEKQGVNSKGGGRYNNRPKRK